MKTITTLFQVLLLICAFQFNLEAQSGNNNSQALAGTIVVVNDDVLGVHSNPTETIREIHVFKNGNQVFEDIHPNELSNSYDVSNKPAGSYLVEVVTSHGQSGYWVVLQ